MKKTLLILSLSCSLFACQNSTTTDANKTADADTTQKQANGPANPIIKDTTPAKNIVESVTRSEHHTKLAEAMKAAGLEQTLAAEGPFTIFAPENEAFDKLPAGSLDNMMKATDKSALATLLSNHVVKGSFKIADLTDGMVLTTLGGKKLTISIVKGLKKINGINIIASDLSSPNGVMHVLDAVAN
jgi:uncharacterized surface protein with fasciclin (FAS1) repeats